MAAKPRKRGRPSVPQGQRYSLRSRSITFRVTPKLFASLKQGAKVDRVSISDEIIGRIDVGPRNAQLQKDLARAMRMVGDVIARPEADKQHTASEILRAAAHILIDAHLGGAVPADLLGARNLGPPMALWMAYHILSGERSLGRT
jgi:hypothetical protein